MDIQIIHKSKRAIRLVQNYEKTGSMEDLNEAFDMMEQVIDIMLQGLVHRAGILSNFSNILRQRFDWTGSIEDLNRAVDVSDIAVNTTPQDHPN